MVKLIGPLHSDNARGKCGKYAIFRNLKGAKLLTRKHCPGSANTIIKTEKQGYQREKYKEGSTAWSALTLEQKEEYKQLAKEKNFSGYNLFIRSYLKSTTTAIFAIMEIGQAEFGNDQEN